VRAAGTRSAFLTGKKRAFKTGSLTFQGIALQLALNLLPMCLETSVTYVVGSYRENRGTDGSVHTAQRMQCVNRGSCGRLGQRRQSPVFSDVRHHAEGRYALDEGHESD
jgi:hypothetical protein